MKKNRRFVIFLVTSIILLISLPYQVMAQGSTEIGVGFSDKKDTSLPMTNEPSGYDNPGRREVKDYYTRFRGRLPQTGESKRVSQLIRLIGAVFYAVILLFLFLGRARKEESQYES